MNTLKTRDLSQAIVLYIKLAAKLIIIVGSETKESKIPRDFFLHSLVNFAVP